jgi:hypothetical protein
MDVPSLRRKAAALAAAALLSVNLVGCGGGGTTPDTNAPTAPPVSPDAAKDINAGAGAGGMKSPGVSVPKAVK